MDILNALKQLRDDIKTWVTANINALNAKIDEKSIPVDNELSSTSINPVQNKVVTEALNNVPRFSGDYNDLINAPNIVEDDSGNMVITDESGNIIFSVDADGAHTTSLTLNGESVEDIVDERVASLVDSAPDTLNTLNELAAALGDDPNFATTVATEIGKKVDKVDGKGLSTNDFTNEYKEKLDGLENIEFEEADPTVPAWAKEAEKPSYTAEEVGALPNTTVIPSIEGLASEEYVDDKIAAIPTPDVSGQIEAHDTSTDAHTNMGWLTSEDEVADSPTPIDADTLNGHDSDYFDNQITIERNRIDKLFNYATPQMYGAKGDGVTDDTDAINACLEENDYVYIPSGTYLINTAVSIITHSNQVLELADNAIIKAPAFSESTRGFAVTIDGVSNVTIRGGKICGDRKENPDSTKECGFGFNIENSQNVKLENCDVYGFRGDCVYIATFVDSVEDYDTKCCADIIINNCKLHDAVRHGITVQGIRGLIVKDTEIYDVATKDYSCAIDIEVHYDYQEMHNILFDNLKSYNTTLGIQMTGKELIRGVVVKGGEFDRLSISASDESRISGANINKMVALENDKIILQRCVINNLLMTYTAHKIVVENCIFNALSTLSELFGFEYKANVESTVDLEVRNSIINTLPHATTNHPLFMNNLIPKSITIDGCAIYINNDKNIYVAAEEKLKMINNHFVYEYDEGNASNGVELNCKKIFIINNVIDTTKMLVSTSGKRLFTVTTDSMVVANNIGIMDTKYGYALTTFTPISETARAEFYNNVFRLYSGFGVENAAFTYTSIGNVFDATT